VRFDCDEIQEMKMKLQTTVTKDHLVLELIDGNQSLGQRFNKYQLNVLISRLLECRDMLEGRSIESTIRYSSQPQYHREAGPTGSAAGSGSAGLSGCGAGYGGR
jgi:hypothetical protein